MANIEQTIPTTSSKKGKQEEDEEVERKEEATADGEIRLHSTRLELLQE